MRFFPRKLIKYQTQIYRIVFQCKFLESDNFYFFGFRLKTSQLLFQAMPARAVILRLFEFAHANEFEGWNDSFKVNVQAYLLILSNLAILKRIRAITKSS